MGLLSIFQRNGQTAAAPAKSGRAGKASARQAPRANTANTSNPAETAEAVREARARARRRLMGATVLLLIGVIGFPLLFETQPRPIPVDLPIEIPARNAAGVADAAMPSAARGHPPAAVIAASGIAPESVSYDNRLSASAPPPGPASAAPGPQRSAFASLAAALTPGALRSSDAAPAVVQPVPAPAPDVRPPPVVAAPPATRVTHAPAPAAPKPAAAPPVSTAPAALLAGAPTGKPSDPAAGANRFVVQIGAFADDAKIRDVRGKVEKIGLKTYTQAVDTPGGKRVRVRVGPYATKAEADRIASKIKADGLPAAVLAL